MIRNLSIAFSGFLLSNLLIVNSPVSSAIITPSIFKTSFYKRVISPANSITIVNNKIIFSKSLQNELDTEISKAKKELERISQNFSIKFTEEIGMVYNHKRGEKWAIKFTFGNLLLNNSQEIIVSSTELLNFKKYFEKTELIEIKGKQYMTTSKLRQIGPMLHQ